MFTSLNCCNKISLNALDFSLPFLSIDFSFQTFFLFFFFLCYFKPIFYVFKSHLCMYCACHPTYTHLLVQQTSLFFFFFYIFFFFNSKNLHVQHKTSYSLYLLLLLALRIICFLIKKKTKKKKNKLTDLLARLMPYAVSQLFKSVSHINKYLAKSQKHFSYCSKTCTKQHRAEKIIMQRSINFKLFFFLMLLTAPFLLFTIIVLPLKCRDLCINL